MNIYAKKKKKNHIPEKDVWVWSRSPQKGNKESQKGLERHLCVNSYSLWT